MSSTSQKGEQYGHNDANNSSVSSINNVEHNVNNANNNITIDNKCNNNVYLRIFMAVRKFFFST